MIIVALLILTLWPTQAAPPTQGDVTLELSKPIERTIGTGEVHSYALTLASGQYAHVTVDQRGIDVVVCFYAPGGTLIVEVDGPNYRHGLEPISLLAETSGAYRLEVRAPSTGKVSGTYEAKLETLRAANEQDRKRIAAQQLYVEAKALRNQRTAQSYQLAIEKYQTVLPVWRSLGEKLMEAFTLHQIGEIYGDLGQYQNALDAYAQASTLYKTLRIPRGETSMLSNMGWIFGELGDQQKALDMYLSVEELERRLGEIAPVSISNIGSSYGRLGQYQTALRYHLRALEMRRASDDFGGQAITLNNIANCYDNLGDKSKALDFYNQSLVLMPKVRNDYYTATTLNHIGVLYRGLGEHEKALDYLNQALNLRKKLGDQRNLAVTQFQIARVERDRGNLAEARRLVEEALDRAEWLRSKVASQQLRAAYFASVQQYREFYIDLLLRLHQQNPVGGFDRLAFNASETGRARSLLELLKEAQTEIRHGVDPLLLKRERELGQLLTEKAGNQMRLLSGAYTEEQAAAAAREIATLTTDYEQTVARIRDKSPQYAALTQPAPLGLEDIQQRVLDRETLLLHFALGEERSFLWVVKPDSATIVLLPKRAEIEPLARRLYELSTARNGVIPKESLEQRRRRLQMADAEHANTAATLSRMLLGPAALELKNKRLLIVSDGVLQLLPFAGLPDPAAPDARPLIANHEIVMAPSASVIALLRETGNRTPATKTLAVLADPVFSPDDPRVSNSNSRRNPPAEQTATVRSATEMNLSKLRRLRFTRQEADEIMRIVADELKLQATDFAANRALATSSELGQYRILHFATHGLINNQHPELSGIVLSLVDEKAQPQNGFLRLYDLYNLKLSADLVVLSACQTAVGKEIRGEGLVGLTRGFMYAGAPRVVASLWQIDDRASAEFMKRFYEGMLREKLSPSAALRAAQTSMLNDRRWNAPYYWAAFTLQGEWK